MTGSPGTGKSSVAKILEARGYEIVQLEKIARDGGCIVGHDEAAGSDLVDIQCLRTFMLTKEYDDIIIDGHLSHKAVVDIAIVLRCSPQILGNRLTERGYPLAKVRENQEAEGVDVILIEAIEYQGLENIYEIDTTYTDATEVATLIEEIFNGGGDDLRPGGVDWSKEVMEWY